MDPMTKMWASFIGIGLMILASVIITFARMKTKGIVRFGLSFVAVLCLLIGLVYGIVSII